MDLALNNLQRLICHKTQQTNQPIISHCKSIGSDEKYEKEKKKKKKKKKKRKNRPRPRKKSQTNFVRVNKKISK